MNLNFKTLKEAVYAVVKASVFADRPLRIEFCLFYSLAVWRGPSASFWVSFCHISLIYEIELFMSISRSVVRIKRVIL